MKIKIAVVYGLGGFIFDPASGERYMVQRLQGIGVDAANTPFNYTDSPGIQAFLTDADWRGIIGDSFGASYMPSYASMFHSVDFAGGFQPSVYSGQGMDITIPENVKNAHCIRDPYWIDTGGLGYAQWVAANPKVTKLLTTEHRGAHPDDWGYSQNLIFNQVKGMIGALNAKH